jgi:ATP-dependent Clp protease protease subunit
MTDQPNVDTVFEGQIYDRLLAERILFFRGEVTDAVANVVCGQLLLLSAADPDRDIHLYINSPGGSVSAGMAVYDTMQFVPNDIETTVVGFAASMGQFLLSSGTPGKRFALPHARVMMHQPSGGIAGTATDIRIQAENLQRTKRTR